MKRLNKHLKKCARRLAKERNAKPLQRPTNQRAQKIWTWEEIYDELVK